MNSVYFCFVTALKYIVAYFKVKYYIHRSHTYILAIAGENLINDNLNMLFQMKAIKDNDFALTAMLVFI